MPPLSVPQRPVPTRQQRAGRRFGNGVGPRRRRHRRTMSVATVAAPVAQTRRHLDEESRTWLVDLRSSGNVQDAAVERLHALLLRAAQFEVARRRCSRTSAATSSRTSRSKPPTTPSCRCSPGSTTSAARVGSDVGLQVRALRGGGEAAPALMAGTRGAARTRDVGHVRERVRRSRTRSPASSWRASRRASKPLSRRTSESARRAGPERRPDRRPRRADGDDARRALQDTARRAAEAPRPSRRRAGGDRLMEHPELNQALGRLLGPGQRRSAATSASTSSIATSSSSSPGPMRRQPCRDSGRTSPAARVPRGLREPEGVRRRRPSPLVVPLR